MEHAAQIGNSLTIWLDALPDQRHRHNWTVVREPDDHLARRFWMIEFPRGEQTRIKFVFEYADFDGVVDVDGSKDVGADELDFWYNAQRVGGDW